MNQKQYIDRISYKGLLSIDIDCLSALHRCHVMSVSFEALDVHFKKEMSLDIGDVYTKVVGQGRGGYCYELNHLFYALLVEIGFDCKMVSCSIYNGGTYGPVYDHMAIVVMLDSMYLVDVGFGDIFTAPLKIVKGLLQVDHFKTYKFQPLTEDSFLLLASLKDDKDFIKKYRFDLHPRTIEDFEEQHQFKQFSPDSYFVQNTICTLPTPEGRKTIFNDIYKVRTRGQVQERRIIDESDLLQILLEEFGIRIVI